MTGEAYGLGYERVDGDPNVAVLHATAAWEATRRLRAWERDQLSLGEGQRLLDVGCGLGEAALFLAPDLGEDGEIVGVDVSAEMLGVARAKARSARCRVRFTVGDACALDEPDDWFHVVRSEGVSPCRVSLMISCRPISLHLRIVIDSCRRSTKPPDVTDSRCCSRCTPSWPQLRSRGRHPRVTAPQLAPNECRGVREC